MNKAMLAALSDADRLQVAQTERAELDRLDEDEVIELHGRIRQARKKYAGQYRRTASQRVVEHGARGRARPQNQHAAMRAEAFEAALARVSRRLAALSAASAKQLRVDRLAAARAGAARPRVASAGGRAAQAKPTARSVTDRPRGDRSLKSAASAKRKSTTQAAGARKQARRDSR
jgi:hypothetical protein